MHAGVHISHFYRSFSTDVTAVKRLSTMFMYLIIGNLQSAFRNSKRFTIGKPNNNNNIQCEIYKRTKQKRWEGVGRKAVGRTGRSCIGV